MRHLFIHFSDLHCSESDSPFHNRTLQAATAIKSHIGSNYERVFFCFSGDIANTGKKKEYVAARKAINSFLSHFDKPKSEIYTPGNHDVDFSQLEDLKSFNEIIAKNYDKYFNTPSMLTPALAGLDNFFTFESDRLKHKQRHGLDRLFSTKEYSVHGQKIVVSEINTAWLSQLHEEPGQLLPGPIESLPKVEYTTFHVLLFHHPLTWIAPDQSRKLRDYCRDNVSLVLCGHEHMPEITEISVEETAFCYQDGGVLASKGSTQSSFNFFVLDTDSRVLESYKAEWEDSIYRVSSARNFSVEHIAKSGQRIRWSTDSRSKFEKHSLPVSHPKFDKEFTLSDLYEWPSLELQDKSITQELPFEGLKSSELLETAQPKFVLIWGGEKSGKTSLLRKLALKSDDQNWLPVVIEGFHIDVKNCKRLDTVLKKEIEAQYGTHSYDHYCQSKSKKILLIDDLEYSSHSVSNLQVFFSNVDGIFDKVIISLSAHSYLQSVLPSESILKEIDFETYRIKELSASQKRHLVKSWVELGGKDYEQEDKVSIEEIYEPLIDALRLSHLPHFPIFLLTILSAAGAEAQPDQFKLSSYGYHFQILVDSLIEKVSRKFRDHGNQLANVSTTNKILSQLAWRLYKNQNIEISESDCKKCIDATIKSSGFPISASKFLDALVESNVVSVVEGSVRFQYPLIRHYFVAKYLSIQLNRDSKVPEVVTEFENLLKTLHKRSSMNIALILFYMSPREPLHKCLRESLREEISGESIQIEDVLAKVPMVLDYDKPLPKSTKSREEERNLELDRKESTREEAPEAFGRHGDIDETIESRVGTAELFFQEFNRRLCLIQLTGQLLRASTGDFEMDEKKEYIRDTVDLGVRHCDKFVEFFNEQKDRIFELISKRFESESENMVTFMKLMDLLTGALAFGIAYETVLQVADSLAHPELQNVLKEMFESGSMETERVALFSIEMNSRKTVDVSKLEKIKKEMESKHLNTWHICRLMVYRHIRLYAVDYRAQQRILALVNIQDNREIVTSKLLNKPRGRQ